MAREMGSYMAGKNPPPRKPPVPKDGPSDISSFLIPPSVQMSNPVPRLTVQEYKKRKFDLFTELCSGWDDFFQDVKQEYKEEIIMAHTPRRPGPDAPSPSKPKNLTNTGKVFEEDWKARCLKAEHRLKVRGLFILVVGAALAALGWWLS